ncbi:AAA family ATPase [Tuanshanicoccus lijuaniae]|nr:AAA family ATPase [Aerococcaceae bacterium zg-1292]QQA36532.1 AAA family ATPase [Aerococcaceae bacterium zg-1292]
MKIESVMVENYRQFEKTELTFDEGITILVGANNSRKTSLITLIKNIFTPKKMIIVCLIFQQKICRRGLNGLTPYFEIISLAGKQLIPWAENL